MTTAPEWTCLTPLGPEKLAQDQPEPQSKPSNKPAHRGTQIWLISYRVPDGNQKKEDGTPKMKREQRITPPLPHKGAAIYWLYQIKPTILSDLKNVRVEPYRELSVKK